MSTNIQGTEWLNQNAGRAYPFQENMTRIPCDGAGIPMPTAVLPNYVVVDMIFTLPGPDNLRMYLSQLAFAGRTLTFVFKETGADSIVCTVSVDKGTHVVNTAYPMAGAGEWFDGRGYLVIGDLQRLSSDLPEGVYNFNSGTTLLEARVVRPALRAVRSIRVAQPGGNTSEPIYGHVKLIAGENIRLEYDAVRNAIWVHAEPNAGYKETCPCEANTQPSLVNTVNGIPFKDFYIVGDGSCIQVTQAGNKITLVDTCSEPCCGCAELDYLTTGMKILESSLGKLETYSQKLGDRISDFVTNYVITVGR